MDTWLLVACIVLSFVAGLEAGYARGLTKLNSERLKWIEYLRELRRDLGALGRQHRAGHMTKPPLSEK